MVVEWVCYSFGTFSFVALVMTHALLNEILRINYNLIWEERYRLGASVVSWEHVSLDSLSLESLDIRINPSLDDVNPRISPPVYVLSVIAFEGRTRK